MRARGLSHGDGMRRPPSDPTDRRLVARSWPPVRRFAAFPQWGQSALGRPGGARHFSPTWRIARNASCGISTLPTAFMRFLPAFCFSSSFFLRVMSPP